MFINCTRAIVEWLYERTNDQEVVSSNPGTESWPILCITDATVNFTIKIVDFSGIQTRTVGIEVKHADHVTTTTALFNSLFKPLNLQMVHHSFIEADSFGTYLHWFKLMMGNT